MTKIKELVSVNAQATLVKGVQLAWYDNQEKAQENARLARGYVFGTHLSRKIGNTTSASSMGIFENICAAYNNPSSSNVFTVIAKYGHGKSHFALVLANYFGLPADAPLLAEMVEQIRKCSDQTTADHFRNFKKANNNKPHLVITIPGHEVQDLRQGFLKALRRILKAHEATRDYALKAVSVAKANWLRNLSDDMRRKAEKYLAEQYEMDLDALLDGLEDFDREQEIIFDELSHALIAGVLDFAEEAPLREIIAQVIEDLCTGASAPFHKMLILFDELGVYAESWCHNRMAAGGFALQQILEACDDKRGKVCFVGFVQRELREFVKNAALQNEFNKISSRLPPETTYALVSNLEDVIGKLLIKTKECKEILRSHAPQLAPESDEAWVTQPYYKDNWKREDFYKSVAFNCYPLHPFTTGLLCRFNFTQGSRTLISVVNSMVEAVADEAATSHGILNWIAPIKLVSAFEEDFKKDSEFYELYENALKDLGSNAEPLLRDVLKALFLFYEGRLKRHSRMEHTKLLAMLSRHTWEEVKSAVQRLRKDFDVIRYSTASEEYSFTVLGANRRNLLEKLRRETAQNTISDIAFRLDMMKLPQLVTWAGSQADEFKDEFAVLGDEWRLESRFLDAKHLTLGEVRKIIQPSYKKNARGTVIYLIAEDSQELDQAHKQAIAILDELALEPSNEPVVIAVPTAPATQLSSNLCLFSALWHMSSSEKEKHGASYAEVEAHIKEELLEQLRILTKVRLVVPKTLRLQINHASQQNTLANMADALFKQVFYHRVPSRCSIMKSNSGKGNAASGAIAKQLIVNELDYHGLVKEKQNVVDQVLVEGDKKWGLLDAGYRIQSPKNERVARAWQLLTASVTEDGWTSFDSLLKKLTAPPYGYDDFTITLLLAAWIGFYKSNVSFKADGKGVPLNKLRENLDKARDFPTWLAKSNVSVRYSGQEHQVKAQEFLEQLRTIRPDHAPAQVTTLLEQTTDILANLPSEDYLYSAITNQAETLKQELARLQELENKIRQHKEAARDARDIFTLIRIDKLLASCVNGTSPNGSFSAAKQFLSERLTLIARQDARLRLDKIERYELEKLRLQRNSAALQKEGLGDLAALFTKALEELEKEYQRLQALKNEQPLADEIKRMQYANLPLAHCHNALSRLRDILSQQPPPSESLSRSALAKQTEIQKQVGQARAWLANLQRKVESVTDLPSAKELSKAITRREYLYADTPEAEIIVQQNSILAAKIEEFEALAETQRAAAMALQREREEKDHAQTAMAQFARITSEQKRLECLTEMVRHSQETGLSSEHTQLIISILQFAATQARSRESSASAGQ